MNMAAAVKAMVPPNVTTPSEFDFTKPELWSTWVKRFDRYITVAGLSGKRDIEKIDLLLYTMGEKSEDILLQIYPRMPADATLVAVKEKFKAYFEPKKNVIFERFKFNSRVQLPDEPVDFFITALYTLAESCYFGTLREELIRDRIVIGIGDSRTSKRLQRISDLDVIYAIDVVRQAEIQSKKGKNIKRTCGRCGLDMHSDTNECPANNGKCNKCGIRGHWSYVCRTKNLRRHHNKYNNQ